MHVGFSLLTLAPGAVGGSETYARGLLSAFAEGAGPEHVTVLAGGDAAATLEAAGPVRVSAARRAVPPAGAARLAGLVHAMAVRGPGDVDVLHFPLTVPAPRAQGPSVVTLHDVLHHELPALFGRAERAFRRVAYDDAARRASVVVTVSEHARQQIVARLGIPGDRVRVVRHGIDHARLHPAAAGDDARLAGLRLPGRPWVLYPANAWPHKNHARLIEALARVPDVSLVLTGATSGRRIDGDRVHHLGYVPAEAIPALYRAADAVVFPSLAEGWGAPVVEAMACGTPVAASSTPAVAEAAGGAATLFDPHDVTAIADAIRRVTRDEALRSELRERGLARAAALTWRASAEGHAEAYERARSTAKRP